MRVMNVDVETHVNPIIECSWCSWHGDAFFRESFFPEALAAGRGG
jgi:hypothetical protein